MGADEGEQRGSGGVTSTSESPDQGRTGAISDQVAAGSSISIDQVPDAELVRRADKAVRQALKAGVVGRDVEELVTWVAQHRVLLRRRAASAAVEAVWADIRGEK